jgi:hypothetical protein
MSGTTILGSGTTYLEGKVLGHSLGFAAWTPPPSLIFVGLCTSQPSATTPGAEVAGGAYVRLTGTFAISATPNVAVNTATIEWPAATNSWGALGWFELWDAQTAGNRLYQGTLIDPVTGLPVTRVVTAGDILRIPAGALAVRAF